MAYTIVDYGTETPQSIDRFGVEQEYEVFAVNGKTKASHWVIPSISRWSKELADRLERKAGKEFRRFRWSSNRYLGTKHYTVLLDNDRAIDITHSADGRVSVRVDHKFVYRETNTMRRNERVRRAQYAQSDWQYEREVAEEKRIDALRARLEGPVTIPSEKNHPTEE